MPNENRVENTMFGVAFVSEYKNKLVLQRAKFSTAFLCSVMSMVVVGLHNLCVCINKNLCVF